MIFISILIHGPLASGKSAIAMKLTELLEQNGFTNVCPHPTVNKETPVPAQLLPSQAAAPIIIGEQLTIPFRQE